MSDIYVAGELGSVIMGTGTTAVTLSNLIGFTLPVYDVEPVETTVMGESVKTFRPNYSKDPGECEVQLQYAKGTHTAVMAACTTPVLDTWTFAAGTGTTASSHVSSGFITSSSIENLGIGGDNQVLTVTVKRSGAVTVS